MYFSDEINLIRTEKVKNELNQYTEKQIKTLVFAELKSISSKEMADAGVAGHQAQAVAVVHQEDYSGQELIEIIEPHPVIRKGIYRVYRTYATTDRVELYVKDEIGS